MLGVVLIFAYLVGSIPFGLVLTKIVGTDIRAVGSGNIGATNVLRSGHKWLGAATLFLDVGKGMAVALMFSGSYLAYVAGLAAVLGHIFSIWLRYKGGKGVATALGVLYATSLPLALIASLIWLLTFFISRIASLSSLASFGGMFVICILMTIFFSTGDQLYLWRFFTYAIITGLIFYTHRANIQRLLTGTEPSFQKGKA